MTHVAAAMAKDPSGRLHAPLQSKVKQALRRFSGDVRLHEFELGRVWLGQIPGDPGLRQEPFRAEDGGVTLLFGRPLLAGASAQSQWDGDDEPRRLHAAMMDARFGILRDTRGDFALLSVAPDGSKLIATVDHLGVRPLYVVERSDALIVSSSLTVIREICGPDLSVDLQGATERAVLGFPLSRRTLFKDVARLGPAEVLSVAEGAPPRSSRYWDWSSEPRSADGCADAQEVYDEFKAAVELRLLGEDTQVSFLSGGMDSRAVVSVVRDLGSQVHSFNFSVEGAQDHRFAAKAAAALGTMHTSIPRTRPVSLREGDWSLLLGKAWDRVAAEDPRPSLPKLRIAWSGDGGSVLVGGVYLTDARVDRLVAGDLPGLASLYAPDVPKWIFNRGLREEMRPTVRKSVEAELRLWEHPDPIRQLYLFLMANDQRRHLDGHFEALPRHGIELHLPFFDAGFVKTISRVPVERLRRHRFYHDWLRCFPADGWNVPWQSYPGHLPCPLPSEDLPNQWSNLQGKAGRRIDQIEKSERRQRTWRMLVSEAFPAQLLSRPMIAALAAFDRLERGSRVGYLLDTAYRLFEVHTAVGQASPHDRDVLV